MRCKPKGASIWLTIGELFPLLEYGSGGYSLPAEDSAHVGRRLALALLAGLMATGVYLYSDRSARVATNFRAAGESPHHQVAAPIVIARNN